PFEARIQSNLELALGRELSVEQRSRLGRDVRLHAARQAEEWLFLARAQRGERARAGVLRWLEQHVAYDASCERLFELARAQRGVLIATAHLGNWEILAAALRQRGLDGAVVGLRKHRDPSSDWLVALRSGLAVRTIAQDAPPREVLGVLRSGGTLGVLCDLEVRRLAGVHVPFFGVPALTQTAPAALARAARLPIVPVRCVARGAGYVMQVDAPLELDPSLSRADATLDVLTRLNATYERWIREDPAQWAWHQPRWRTRPGERDAPPLHSRLRTTRAESGPVP
ncbi:MAG TPA: hypothetical protein VM509_08410, partial [Planctomycetota bacterium]|nr:hypothetical protein [Planctomycetota bacterium]